VEYTFFPSLAEAQRQLEAEPDKTGLMVRPANLEDIFVRLTVYAASPKPRLERVSLLATAKPFAAVNTDRREYYGISEQYQGGTRWHASS
jgi:hypothetical protein